MKNDGGWNFAEFWLVRNSGGLVVRNLHLISVEHQRQNGTPHDLD